jgi:hypothetical protein
MTQIPVTSDFAAMVRIVTKVVVAAIVLIYTSFGKVGMYAGRELYIYM